MHQWPGGKATQKVVVYPIPRPSWETKADVSQSNENLYQFENEAIGSNGQNRNASCIIQLDNHNTNHNNNNNSGQKTTNQDKEIAQLKEQLDAQLKVNSDLKKLLVASIGDDLHCKMDVLVRTKAHLTNEVSSCTSKMIEDYENIDKLTVETNLWRTKFQASCVLLNLLTSEKNKSDEAFLKSQNSLQTLLDERRRLNCTLLQTNGLLNCIHSALFPLRRPSAARLESERGTTTTELADSNRSLVETIYYLLHGSREGTTDGGSTGPSEDLTFAEALATEVLSKGAQEVSRGGPGDICSIVQSSKTFLGTTFNCCRKCKGSIMNV